MTTTTANLEAGTGGKLAMVVTIEGLKYAPTTTDGSVFTALQTMYQADGYVDLLPGLSVLGEVRQAIKPFKPVAEAGTVELFVQDGGTLTTYLFARAGATKTYVRGTAGVTADATTIPAENTDSFDEDSPIYLGRETIGREGKTAGGTPSFDTCTRGLYSDGRTSADARLGHSSRFSGTGDTGGEGIAPRITDRPMVHPGRLVSIYVHHLEGGAPVAIASRACIWRGIVEEIVPAAGGIKMLVAPLLRVQQQLLLGEQFTGKAVAWLTVGDNCKITVKFYDGVNDYIDSVAVTAGVYAGWEHILNAVNIALQGVTVPGGVYHGWSVRAPAEPDAPTTRLQAELAATDGVAFASTVDAFMRFSDGLGEMMGFGDGWIHMEPRGDFTRCTAGAGQPPGWCVILPDDVATGDIFVTRTGGRWISQPRTFDNVPDDVIGFLKIGSLVLGVSYAAVYDDPIWQFKVSGRIDPETGWQRDWVIPDDLREQLGHSNPPEFTQPWYEQSTLGDLLLRTLVSTGTAALNHATYDDRDASMGCSIPWSFVVDAGFLAATSQVLLQIEKPTKLAEVFGPLLAACGQYLLQDAGRLRLTALPWDTSIGATAITASTDAHRAFADATWSSVPPMNRVHLKTGNPPLVRARDITVNAVDSICDYGPLPGPDLEAPGLIDLDAWRDQVALPALAYFKEGLQGLRLPIGWKLCTLVPGDLVAITDPSVIDPATGAHGVTSLGAVVLASKFNFGEGSGEIEVVHTGTIPQRAAVWAQSGRVSSYTEGPPAYVTIAEAEYSAADINEFSADDVVLIHSIDASAASESWERTITSVDTANRRLYFTGALTGYDVGRTYDVTAATIANTVARQRSRYAWHSADGVTMGDSVAARIWMPHQEPTTGAFADIGLGDMTQIASAVGMPAAASYYNLAARVLDRIVRYRGRTLLHSLACTNVIESPGKVLDVTLTDPHLFYWAPLDYPSIAEDWRSIRVELSMKVGGASAYTVTPIIATQRPRGTGLDAGTFAVGPAVWGSEIAVNSTSYAISSQSIVPIGNADGDGRLYLVLIAERTSGSDDLYLRDCTVWGA